MRLVEVIRGDGPVILGFPHTGTFVPGPVKVRLNANGQRLTDTDWYVDLLYGGLLDSATSVRAAFHRYVIDANRDPSGASLYPGQNTTGLCPLTDFDGAAIYVDGKAPDVAEIEDRRGTFHAAYHASLSAEVERVQARHGVAILFDCHSIRSRIPFLFDGVLPDFNIGTNGGASCAREVAETVRAACIAARGYSTVVDGRFRGGWTTRHYGRPRARCHAIQMELAQSTYLAREEAPFVYDPDGAGRLRTHLERILKDLDTLARSGTL